MLSRISFTRQAGSLGAADNMSAATPASPLIQVDELRDRLTGDRAPLVIDMRAAEQFARGAIAGAIHLPLDDIQRNVSVLPEGDNLVFVCESGGRSAYAASLAAATGRTRIYNLDGGMQAWLQSGLTTEPAVP